MGSGYTIDFLSDLENFGMMGYTLEEVEEILEPSCDGAGQLAKIMFDLKNKDSALARSYRHGQKSAKYKHDQAIALNDPDNNDAMLKANEILREDQMQKMINDYYGLC